MSPYELGESKSIEALPELIKYLLNGSDNDKRLAASAVAKIAVLPNSNCELAKKPLLNNLENSKPQVRQYSLKAIRHIRLQIEDLESINKLYQSESKDYNIKAYEQIFDEYKWYNYEPRIIIKNFKKEELSLKDTSQNIKINQSDLELKKLLRAREIVRDIVDGNNPFTNTKLEPDSIMSEEKMKNFYIYLDQLIDMNIEKARKKKKQSKVKFAISQERLNSLKFREDNISITDFCKAVNMLIDKNLMKPLNRKTIVNRLKKLEILVIVETDEGNKRTVLGEKAPELGIHTRIVTYGNRSYEQIIYDKRGQKFLIENLIDLLK